MDKPKHNIFQDTILRKDDKGKLYLMNHPEKGWDSSSIIIESEQVFVDTFNARLGEWTHDKFSEYCPVFKVGPPRYGVIYFDPEGGSDGKGGFDWAFCKNVALEKAESVALTWDRVAWPDNHPVFVVGVAPWRSYDIELEAQDLVAALAWSQKRIVNRLS